MACKNYWFPSSFKSKEFNSSIRDKRIIIRILLEIITYLNSMPVSAFKKEAAGTDNCWLIHISKISRILIKDGKKIHSFYFPFSLIEETNSFRVKYYENEINSKICTILKSVFCEADIDCELGRFLEQLDIEQESLEITKAEKTITSLLIVFLLSFEPCYVRFDHDIFHHQEENHPIDHLDVNYTNSGSFKLGLKTEIEMGKLLEYLERDTRCPVLE